MDLWLCRKNGVDRTKEQLLNTEYGVCIARLDVYDSYGPIEEMRKGKYLIRANMDMDTTLEVERTLACFEDCEFLFMAAIYELLKNVKAKTFYIFFPNEHIVRTLMYAFEHFDDGTEDPIKTKEEIKVFSDCVHALSQVLDADVNVKFLDMNTFNGQSEFFVTNNINNII